MLRRVFRLAMASALGRAWARRSPLWLSLAVALWLFRFVDARSSRRARRPSA